MRMNAVGLKIDICALTVHYTFSIIYACSFTCKGGTPPNFMLWISKQRLHRTFFKK